MIPGVKLKKILKLNQKKPLIVARGFQTIT